MSSLHRPHTEDYANTFKGIALYNYDTYVFFKSKCDGKDTTDKDYFYKCGREVGAALNLKVITGVSTNRLNKIKEIIDAMP